MLKIGIVTTSVREGRQSLEVAKWALNKANAQNLKDVSFEIVDLKDYNLPILTFNPSAEEKAVIGAWSQKISEFDGYIFVVAEYNHTFTGAIKNALDYLKPEFENKAAGFIGYGGVGGARAIEHFRGLLAELSVATTQKNVNFLLAVDFENFQTFKPTNGNDQNAQLLLSQVVAWSKALKTIR